MVLIFLALVTVSASFTAYALNNKRYSCKSGKCEQDSIGDFASKIACQNNCKTVNCKSNFDPNCQQSKDKDACENKTHFCQWNDPHYEDTKITEMLSNVSSMCPYISNKTNCQNTLNICTWETP